MSALASRPTPYAAGVRDERTLEVAGVRWWLRAGVDAAGLAPRLERALAQLGSALDLRSGRRKRLFRLALGAGLEADHLLKRNGYPLARGCLRRIDGSKARRELAIAEALAERGVPVVVPLAAGERRRFGRVVECFLLVPLIADARDLRQLWGDRALGARERRRLMVSLGALVRRAHEAGLHQNDLAPNNVLVSGGAPGALRLVDFERARLRPCAGTRARRRMLAKLARAAGALPAAQRLRFLQAYAGDRDEARRWWARLREEAPRLARRDDIRMRRSASRDGRGFERIARGVWRGHARRGADPGAGLRALAPGPAPSASAAPVEMAAGIGRVVYRRLSARRSRRLWARANTLAARGLAPVPVASLSDRERTLLIFEAGSGMRPLGSLACDAAQRRAVARLLAELTSLGELRDELEREAFTLVRSPSGRLRAQLVAPHAFRFTGRAGGARSRAAAARLLACLDLPADLGV